MKHVWLVLLLLVGSANTLFAQAESSNWKAIEDVFGRKGTEKNGYFKVTFPRSDLNVKVGDVSVAPGLALTSWMGFAPHGKELMVMGDMVLTESEIAAVESKLEESGFEITALHNHLIGETPAIKYLHIEGMGDAKTLAEGLKSVFSLTGTPMTPPAAASQVAVDWSAIQTIMGSKGDAKGMILQYGLPRAEKIMEHEMEVPPLLGMANSINFQMIGSNVAATGDFVLIGSEVNPVIAALRNNGITVTAVHNHMLEETPRLFMLHFWGYGPQETVARGLRAALDKVHLKP